MYTLSELLRRIEEAPLTNEKSAPNWKFLRKYGGGVVARAEFSGDAFIEVFANGYAFYYNGFRWTTFSMQDTTLSYEFNVQEDNPAHKERTVCRTSLYYDISWVVRTLLEAESRIFKNQKYSRLSKNTLYYDSTRDDWGVFGADTDDPLTNILAREKSDAIQMCLCSITEKQRRALEECLGEGRTKTDFAAECGISRQAVADTICRGCDNFIRIYDEVYGSDD